MSDIRMPGDAAWIARAVARTGAGHDVVLMTAYEDMTTIVTAMREGAVDFIVKPISLDALHRLSTACSTIEHAAQRAARKEVPAAYTLDALVGRDPRMIEAFKMVGQAAAGRANVLVRGESGTGKELIARAIHFNSRDAGDPFVAVNCAALPTTLLESELFGHARGAFTGAVGARRGRSRSPDAAPCSSTRSATRRSSSRASCCACFRSASSIHSAPSIPREPRHA